jgi:hypothetical protein
MKNFVECQICGYKSGNLGHHLKQKHNMNGDEYKKLYPGFQVCVTVGLGNAMSNPVHRKKISDVKQNFSAERKIEIGNNISKGKTGKHPHYTEESFATIRAQRKTEEWRNAQSDRITKAWENPITRSNMIFGHQRHPNLIEIHLDKLFLKWFDGKIVYTGCTRMVGKCIPDFSFISASKCIDYFGNYWHPDPIEEAERIAKFKKEGIDLLVIWENDYLKYGDEWLYNKVNSFLTNSLEHNSDNQQLSQVGNNLESSTTREIHSENKKSEDEFSKKTDTLEEVSKV